MKKVIFGVTMITLLFMGFQACKQKQRNVDVHNAKNSLDWVGFYTGTIPCADCEGIEVSINLKEDSTYTMHYYYIGTENNLEPSTGTFTWDETGNIVVFSDTNSPHYFKVGENMLTQLDMEGNPITGELADNYILTKVDFGNGHNAQNSLNWTGVYTGTIPCANCEGIDVNMTLNQDETYEVVYTYLGKKSEPSTTSGKFTWDNTGSIITLNDTSIPPHYIVGENTLKQLDMEGNVITGEHADMYILHKAPEAPEK